MLVYGPHTFGQIHNPVFLTINVFRSFSAYVNNNVLSYYLQLLNIYNAPRNALFTVYNQCPLLHILVRLLFIFYCSVLKILIIVPLNF